MRVGITCYPTYGGRGIVATELGLEPANRGHEVHFITCANPIRLDPGIPRIPCARVPNGGGCGRLRARTSDGRAHAAAGIWTLHGTRIGQDLRRHTIEVFDVTNGIRVIYNFVNCDLYKPSPERSNTPKRLIHISNFRPVKRVLDCIRILAEVRKEVAAELHMVGDGPDRGPAQCPARELGVDRYTTLLPGERESFGLAPLEAMACGVPPVATRVGGVPEPITGGGGGFLEPVGDTPAQARRAIPLFTDSKLHESMAQAARATAGRRFCTDLIIPQYESYYDQIASGG